MADALVLWLHILAAVVFIGPQVFLAVVAVPALRTLDDARARQQATRAITRGFGVLGGIALAVLIATGLYNYYSDSYNPLMDADAHPRYFTIMQIKLGLVTIVIVLTALHALVLGRRTQSLQESGASESELARARMWSMAASVATLAASIGILLCAALLASNWSKA